MKKEYNATNWSIRIKTALNYLIGIAVAGIVLIWTVIPAMQEASKNCTSPCQALAGTSAPIDWWHPFPILLICLALIGAYVIIGYICCRLFSHNAGF